MPVFVDSNVFHYAAGSSHRYREPCRKVLHLIAEGVLDGTTNVEVVQELLYVLGRRGRRADGIRLARSVLALFPAPIPVTAQDMRSACDLMETYPDVPPRDAIHAATMINSGIHRIVTTDAHFDIMEEVERLDPIAL